MVIVEQDKSLLLSYKKSCGTGFGKEIENLWAYQSMLLLTVVDS